MSVENAIRGAPARVIVVGNEKGGSGKSTVAMHAAIALAKAGQSVATIDLDTRQRSLTRYIENRRIWARQLDRRLEIPEHFSFGTVNYPTASEEAAGCRALKETVEMAARRYGFVVIDTPGHDSYLSRCAHSLADILVTPLNDSFVDLDVLGTVDPGTLQITSISHYAHMVEQARGQRRTRDHGRIDWIVLRNRLSTLSSRNKRLVGEGLQDLSRRLNFRHVDGLAERMIFRELYPRGLTAVDDLDQAMLQARPTMSHVTARLEMLKLLEEMVGAGAGRGRDAA
jgi:chromosome partitioning protein